MVTFRLQITQHEFERTPDIGQEILKAFREKGCPVVGECGFVAVRKGLLEMRVGHREHYPVPTLIYSWAGLKQDLWSDEDL